MDTKKLTFTGVFIAIGVLSAHLFYIPVVVAKCYPVQHAINVLLAVLFGTRYSVSAALSISILRNILGTGTLLAFPGSIIGALLAGVLYKKTNHILGAVIGEFIGTGIIGGLLAFPIAKFIIGSEVGAFFFIIPFAASSAGGCIIAYLISQTPVMAVINEKLK